MGKFQTENIAASSDNKSFFNIRNDRTSIILFSKNDYYLHFSKKRNEKGTIEEITKGCSQLAIYHSYAICMCSKDFETNFLRIFSLPEMIWFDIGLRPMEYVPTHKMKSVVKKNYLIFLNYNDLFEIYHGIIVFRIGFKGEDPNIPLTKALQVENIFKFYEKNQKFPKEGLERLRMYSSKETEKLFNFYLLMVITLNYQDIQFSVTSKPTEDDSKISEYFSIFGKLRYQTQEVNIFLTKYEIIFDKKYHLLSSPGNLKEDTGADKPHGPYREMQKGEYINYILLSA